MTIRLLILVQQRTFADVLSFRLEAEQDIEVVAALRARAPSLHLFAGSQADVILIDGDLSDDAACRLCEDLARHGVPPYVVILGHSADPASIVRAIRAGAAGWVGRNESLDRLIEVIRGAARGETWLPPGQTQEVMRLLLHGPGQEDGGGGELLAALTPREREVLVCLAAGTGRREMAAYLHISPNTARTHLQNLMAKLGVHSALEAVALTRSQLADLISERRIVC
jgi:DNA-binding NarL/FixJ family response regulator